MLEAFLPTLIMLAFGLLVLFLYYVGGGAKRNKKWMDNQEWPGGEEQQGERNECRGCGEFFHGDVCPMCGEPVYFSR